ncbi:MAG: Lon-like protease helical domain-containing protein, partial [Chloroflexota bacterium]
MPEAAGKAVVDVGHLKVAPNDLRWRCEVDRLEFDCTDQLGPPSEFIGQDRAVSAVEFGFAVDQPGYNIFVSGLTGTGRTSAIRLMLERVIEERLSSGEPLALEDICYVRDQEHPDQPRALRFPAGRGKVFK